MLVAVCWAMVMSTAMITRLSAFIAGMREFRTDWTKHYADENILEWYDRGRDLAHRLTFRHWDS